MDEQFEALRRHTREQESVLRFQILDSMVGGMVRVWLLASREFRWLNPEAALELCLSGQASVADPTTQMGRPRKGAL